MKINKIDSCSSIVTMNKKINQNITSVNRVVHCDVPVNYNWVVNLCCSPTSYYAISTNDPTIQVGSVISITLDNGNSYRCANVLEETPRLGYVMVSGKYKNCEECVSILQPGCKKYKTPLLLGIDCFSELNITAYSDSDNFADALILSDSEDMSKNLAPSIYSDGIISRYWDGNSFDGKYGIIPC